MSINAMKLALAALETCRIRSVSEWSVEDITPKNVTAAIAALRTAIQQAEAQQPATAEPVAPDSSEHLRVIASLGDALRRLSFAAQTTGGTDGPDAELQSAIGQAEQALSLGGIWQAMSATPEPVKATPYNPTEEMRWAMKRIDPALSSEQCRALWSAAWSVAPSTHPAPSVPGDVVRDAERYRWLREQNESLESFTFYVGCDNGPDDDGSVEWVGADLDAAIDAAMLAAK